MRGTGTEAWICLDRLGCTGGSCSLAFSLQEPWQPTRPHACHQRVPRMATLHYTSHQPSTPATLTDLPRTAGVGMPSPPEPILPPSLSGSAGASAGFVGGGSGGYLGAGQGYPAHLMTQGYPRGAGGLMAGGEGDEIRTVRACLEWAGTVVQCLHVVGFWSELGGAHGQGGAYGGLLWSCWCCYRAVYSTQPPCSINSSISSMRWKGSKQFMNCDGRSTSNRQA